MSFNPDAYQEPPEVLLVDGEVILRSPHNEACYTVEAARRLIDRLNQVLGKADGTDRGPAQGVNPRSSAMPRNSP